MYDLTPNLLDTNFIIDALESNSLEDIFNEISSKRDEVWITPDIFKELKNKLDDEKRIRFEKLVKKGVKEGYVVDSRHKFRIRKPFKNLITDLKMFRVNLSRTDRNLIALKFQIKGEIKTNDEGIEKALRLLREKDTPWRKYALAIEFPPTEDFVEHN